MLEAAARQTYLLGDIHDAAEQQEEAIRIYESAGAEVRALNARRWLGRFRWLLGDPEGAARDIGRAIDGLERHGPSPELAMAYSFRAQSVMLEPDFDAGEAWSRKAIAVAEETGSMEALVHAYNNLGLCLMSRGDPTGVEHLRHSLDLALEHHLPDDVGRAYANMSGQGQRVFPFRYAEAEALMIEAVDFAARTIPDGIFDHWLRSGWGEFLLVSGRWTEADRVLTEMNPGKGEAYLRSEVLSLRSHLDAFRGRFDEASDVAADAVETAMRIGDLQAVLPTNASLAAARAGQGDDGAAIAALDRAIERRGTIAEAIISGWFLFEATDTLEVIATRDAGSPHLRAGLDLLAAFATTVGPEVARGGDLVQTEVVRALFGAAVEQLASLARRAGVDAPPVPAGAPFPGRSEATAILDREHRTFDAARIRLWLAEEEADPTLLGQSLSLFEELGAYQYVARSQRLSAGG